jgi:hypothetical protein
MKLLKIIVIPAIVCFFSLTLLQAQDLQTPMPSPTGTITQLVGLTEVSISYSRPGVKGREIFGNLVPYGELWRTGANKSTTISFSKEVKLEGKYVAAGEYALFTIPGKQDWTVIISKDIGSGTSKYKMEDDVLRFKVMPRSLPEPVERLTFEIADITDESARIVLRWASTEISFALTADTENQVMAQIDEIMDNEELKDANAFFRAAEYYFSNDKDTDQAQEWITRAVELNPDAFWMLRLKSRIEAKQGDYKKAIETAQLSLKAAEKAGNQQYVQYNQEAIAEWQTKL